MLKQFGNGQQNDFLEHTMEQKFKTPEEELNYLRAKVADHEKI